MTPSDFRAELARQRIPLYRVAAGVGLHPSRLGAMLNERLPMPADVAERLSEALNRAATPSELVEDRGR
jgi:predicted urease superfamily metal-dependent hydrolase